jgi:ABC-type Zn uptake system ZnuABC Zn-binding protein ZnuA
VLQVIATVKEKNVKKTIPALVALILVLTLVLAGCSVTSTTGLKVATSTSLLTCIVEQVGGKYVDVIQMVPPNQHPGNFDAIPGDIEKLATAKLFILHGWPGETYADELITAANNSDLDVVKANVNGNWMIPSVQLAATDRVAEILAAADPDNANQYWDNADKYKEKITAVEADVLEQIANADISNVNVIASARHADFLQWAGFNVVANFQNAQALTPKVIQDLVDQGKDADVALVVNNLQDGQDAGKPVAEALGVNNVNFSNFPGGLQNTETWEKAIKKNVQLLIDALQ